MTTRPSIASEYIDDAIKAIDQYRERLVSAYGDIVTTEAQEFNHTIKYLDERFPELYDQLHVLAHNKENVIVESKNEFPYPSVAQLDIYFTASRMIDSEMFALVYSASDEIKRLADIWIYVEAMERLRQEREKKVLIMQTRYSSYSARLQRVEATSEASRLETGSAITLALNLVNDIERSSVA